MKKAMQQQTVDDAPNQESVEIERLKELLNASLEREKRVLADYQNLQRRVQEERSQIIKFANKELCLALLQPLEHLSLAATNLHDRGLDMVVGQLWKELANFGLVEIDVMGKNFDLNTMEVVEKKARGEKVIALVRKGFTLNGVVIQHAQVVLD